MDKREQILSRLQAILASISGISDFRNVGDIPDAKRPALVLLDGDEAVNAGQNIRAHRPQAAPLKITMTPEIFYLPPTRAEGAATRGESANAMRVTLLEAILFDETLAGLIGSTNYVRYKGLKTDFNTGKTLEGQLMLALEISYTLNPNDL